MFNPGSTISKELFYSNQNSKTKIVCISGGFLVQISRENYHEIISLRLEALKDQFKSVWKRFELFMVFSQRNQFDYLYRRMDSIFVKDGYSLFRKNSEIEYLYVLLSGEVTLTKQRALPPDYDNLNDVDKLNKRFREKERDRHTLKFTRKISAPYVLSGL